MYSAPATPYGRVPTARMSYGRAPTAQSTMLQERDCSRDSLYAASMHGIDSSQVRIVQLEVVAPFYDTSAL